MTEPIESPPVTIIVPVYGDLPSLAECVRSLKENVDQTIHRVLFVNDCGPDADAIEAFLLNSIADQPGFRYERNPRNLGFVENCNRAALELDQTDNDILLLNSDTVTTPGFLEELSEVLHLAPEHGAVCPRSNNATIASFPFKLRDNSVGRKSARTAEVHSALRQVLPQFNTAPVAMGFCILIRRELIREFGLFDDAFSPGYGEENDFCLRVARHGYLSLIANRALVFHMVGRSFVGPRREALRSAHEKLLVARYPSYTRAVRTFLNRERDPVDVFADSLVPGEDTVRVLIYLETGKHPDPWSRMVLDRAKYLATPDIRFTISAPDRSVARLARLYPTLSVTRHTRLDGQWDVAITRTESMSREKLARMNRTSLRWILVGNLSGKFERLCDASIDETDEPQFLDEIISGFARSTVDIVRLRLRWRTVTSTTDEENDIRDPIESVTIRVIRRAESVAPRTIGWAKGAARAILNRS